MKGEEHLFHKAKGSQGGTSGPRAERRTGAADRRRQTAPEAAELQSSDSSQLAGAIPPQDSLNEAELVFALTAVMGKLRRGVLVIDRDGFIHALNAAASEILSAGDALRMLERRLTFRSADQQRLLDQFLSGSKREPALALSVERTPPRSVFRILVCPLSSSAATQHARPLYAVLVYQPEAGRQIPLPLLRGLYGLTPAEAKLVAELFGGASIAAAARLLGISSHTARAQLKSIFRKCEVQSQGELLQLISLGPRTL